MEQVQANSGLFVQLFSCLTFFSRSFNMKVPKLISDTKCAIVRSFESYLIVHAPFRTMMLLALLSIICPFSVAHAGWTPCPDDWAYYRPSNKCYKMS